MIPNLIKLLDEVTKGVSSNGEKIGENHLSSLVNKQTEQIKLISKIYDDVISNLVNEICDLKEKITSKNLKIEELEIELSSESDQNKLKHYLKDAEKKKKKKSKKLKKNEKL